MNERLFLVEMSGFEFFLKQTVKTFFNISNECHELNRTKGL